MQRLVLRFASSVAGWIIVLTRSERWGRRDFRGQRIRIISIKSWLMSCRILVILHSDHSRGFTSKFILAKVLHWLTKSLYENRSLNSLKGRGKVKHEISSQRPAPQFRARILTSAEPYQKQVDDFQFNIVEMTAWLEGKLALQIWGPVVRRPISANPGLNFNPGFYFFCSKAVFRIIFSTLFRAPSSNCGQLNLLFKLSCPNWNFALTLGYPNPALNNPAQLYFRCYFTYYLCLE